MKRVKIAGFIVVMALSLAVSGLSQGMGGRGGSHAPQMFGAFKPVVGTGAQYQATTKDRPMEFAYVIVGQEDVEGSTGYWMEIRTSGGETAGEMVMKELVVTSGDKPQIKRMIMQSPGRPPMEMPAAMMNMTQRGSGGHAATTTDPGVKVGSETITVPAGTFDCEHYRKQTQGGPVDVWVSARVSPYGTVKMTSGEMTMVLEKVLSGETSHVKGEPQKMNFGMPRP
jgi:hypothetical protein